MQSNLEGVVIEKKPPTRAGLVWIFHNCLIYTDDFRDVFTMLSSERRRKKIGEFHGVIFGEVPDLGPVSASNCRILYEWIRDDPRIEEHKRVKRFLRKHPELKQDLRRDTVRNERGEVVRDTRGRAKKTQRLKTLDRFKGDE